MAFHLRHSYTDRHYHCLRCKTACVFTAQEQKYSFEVQKASIHQQRVLCGDCWEKANGIELRLRTYEALWIESRAKLRNDRAFLAEWLSLLQELERFATGTADTAKKNMLVKLLASDARANTAEPNYPM